MSEVFDQYQNQPSTDPSSKEWIKEYVDSKNEFRDSLAQQARDYSSSGLDAEASVVADIALNIPLRGEYYVLNHEAVIQAMLMNDPKAQAAHEAATKQYQGMEAIRYIIRSKVAAMQKAFALPDELYDELTLFVSKGADITEPEEAFLHAYDTFYNDGKLLEASVSSIKLSESYDSDHQTDAIDSTIQAIQLIMGEVKPNDESSISAKDTARADTTLAYFKRSVDNAVQLFDEDPASISVYKDIYKTALYTLDDIDHFSPTVLRGYRQLASVTHFAERRFFKEEAYRLNQSLELQAEMRKHRHKILLHFVMDREFPRAEFRK
jgi:hypothetical protein